MINYYNPTLVLIKFLGQRVVKLANIHSRAKRCLLIFALCKSDMKVLRERQGKWREGVLQLIVMN